MQSAEGSPYVCALFHSVLYVMSSPPRDTLVNTTITHTPPVARMSVCGVRECVCVYSTVTDFLVCRGHAATIQPGQGCCVSVCVSGHSQRAFSSQPPALIRWGYTYSVRLLCFNTNSYFEMSALPQPVFTVSAPIFLIASLIFFGKRVFQYKAN